MKIQVNLTTNQKKTTQKYRNELPGGNWQQLTEQLNEQACTQPINSSGVREQSLLNEEDLEQGGKGGGVQQRQIKTILGLSTEHPI